MLYVVFSDLIGLPKTKTAESAKPRNRSTVTRPLSSLEGGVWAESNEVKGGLQTSSNSDQNPTLATLINSLPWAANIKQ